MQPWSSSRREEAFNRLLGEHLERKANSLNTLREPALLTGVGAGMRRSPLKLAHLPQELCSVGCDVRLEQARRWVEKGLGIRADERVPDS